jgi:hypothetical protein
MSSLIIVDLSPFILLIHLTSQLQKIIGFPVVLYIFKHFLYWFCDELTDILIENMKQINDANTDEKYLSNRKPRVKLIERSTTQYNIN